MPLITYREAIRHALAEHHPCALGRLANDPGAVDPRARVCAERKPAHQLAASELHEGRAVSVARDQPEQVTIMAELAQALRDTREHDVPLALRDGLRQRRAAN